jgi:hypothetical protein
MRRVWNEEKDEVLIRLYPIAKLESLAFRLGVSKTALKSRANKLGIYRSNEKKHWTRKELDYLREHYANDSSTEIAMALGRLVNGVYQKAAKMHLSKAPDFFSVMGKIGTQHPKAVAARFKKGEPPHNKGKKIEEYMSEEGIKRSSATRFKKGRIPENARPVGWERVDKEGYVWVKVAGRRTMTLKHRWVWETQNGKIPEGYGVAFKDGDRTNCDISNLYLLSKADNVRNKIAGESKEKRAIRICKAVKTRKEKAKRNSLRMMYGLQPIV